MVFKDPPVERYLSNIIEKQLSGALSNVFLKQKQFNTEKQLEEIARVKMQDLNAYDVKQARKIIAGTAKNMGLEIVSE